mmetsp:Transcript_34919/g.33963  ORF Transcript_34919/g.33963 Transcript_34919/m.33963 type:complete len:224 (-) Transcript_34919:26-697(-)
MRFILPELMWTGMSISIYTGILVPTIYDTMPVDYTDNEKFQASMLAMIYLGVGEVIGGIFMGLLIDKYGCKNCTYINILNVLVASSLVAIYMYNNRYSWMAYAMTFFWGWQDSFISIHIDSILGFEFPTTKEPFSVDSFMESLTVFSFEVVNSMIDGRESRIAYIFLVGMVGIISNYMTLYFKFRPKSVIPEDFLENYLSQKKLKEEGLLSSDESTIHSINGY